MRKYNVRAYNLYVDRYILYKLMLSNITSEVFVTKEAAERERVLDPDSQPMCRRRLGRRRRRSIAVA